MAKTIERIFEDKIYVYGSIISYGQSFVCTKNISMISVQRDASSTGWVWGLIILILGFYSFVFSVAGQLHFLICLFAFLLMPIGAFLMIYLLRKDKKRGYHMTLDLNSGVSIYFARCDYKDFVFLNKVMGYLIDCINGHVVPQTINFKECKFEKSQFGDGMTVTNQASIGR